MAKTPGQRLKLMKMREVLFRNTDEDHLLSRTEIERLMNTIYGIEVERKTFYTDIEALEEYAGSEMIRVREGHDVKYGIPEEMRDFKLAELKLLTDCVLAAKFLTREQTYHFISKLEKCCSIHAARQLQRQVCIPGRTVTELTDVFHSVDILNKCIGDDLQVKFRYFNRDVHKEKVYHREGGVYFVSPWALTWDDGKYYLIGEDMSPDVHGIRHYRVDKMDNVELTSIPRSFSEEFDGLRQAEYSNGLFGMFSGEMNSVTLVCRNEMAGIMIDRFGSDLMFAYEDKEHFRTHVKVVDSNQFYAWIISLGSGVRVAGPQQAIEKMRAIAGRLYDTYSENDN